MIKHTTTIHEVCRKDLGISRDEYALCQFTHYRAADPRQKKAGWCCDKKEDVADFIGMTRAGLYKMLDKVSLLGLVEVDAATGYFRITARFIDAENFAQKQKKDVNKVDTSKKERVNKVNTVCKQSLHDNVNKVTVNIEGIGGLNKVGKEGECESPAQKTDLKDFVFPDLEEKKEKGYTGPAALPFPTHSDMPRDIETHRVLFDQLKSYYENYPLEWSDAVKEGPGSRYSDEELFEMLKKYSTHIFSRRNPHQKFSAHNADFCRWVKEQKNHTVATPTQSTYARPASNKMRTVEVNTGYAPESEQLF